MSDTEVDIKLNLDWGDRHVNSLPFDEFQDLNELCDDLRNDANGLIFSFTDPETITKLQQANHYYQKAESLMEKFVDGSGSLANKELSQKAMAYYELARSHGYYYLPVIKSALAKVKDPYVPSYPYSIFQSHDRSLEMVKADPSSLRYVAQQSEDLCLEAVRRDGTALRFVERQSQRLCSEAVKQNPKALLYVVEASEMLNIIAVRYHPEALQYVRKQTHNVCINALSRDGLALQYVEKKTKVLSSYAIHNNALALQYVDKWDDELALVALKGNREAVHFFQHEVEGAELYLNDFQKDLLSVIIQRNSLKTKKAFWNPSKPLTYAEYKSHRLPKKRLKLTKRELQFWRSIHREDESFKYLLLAEENIFEAAIKHNPMWLKYVNEQTDELCLSAVNSNGLALQYVHHQTAAICAVAVQQNGLALQFVREQSLGLSKLAIRNNAEALQFVRRQTKELCELAVAKDGLALQYVRKSTKAMCIAAVRRNRSAIQYVNPKLFERQQKVKTKNNS